MPNALPPWRQHLVGTGRLKSGVRPLHPEEAQQAALVRFVIEDATAQAYSDAQLDDYQVRARERLIRRPPLQVSMRARFSHEADALRGTAGFGFWNYPVAGVPTPPRAIWFFYGSPPGDLPLVPGVAGHGWKAATIDTGRPRALALLPLAPIVVPLMHLPVLYRGLWPLIQRAVGIAEAPVRVAMTEWHTYTIEWGEQTSRFIVDDRIILDNAPSPRGPLCFVAWMDNQYLVATPQGRIRWGLLDVPGTQWMEVESLVLE